MNQICAVMPHAVVMLCMYNRIIMQFLQNILFSLLGIRMASCSYII